MAYLLPRCDLGVVPDAGRMRLTTSLAGDVAPLGDEERPRNARALAVVLDAHVGVHVFGVGTNAGERRESDAVGEGYVADLNRLEEPRNGGGRHGAGGWS